MIDPELITPEEIKAVETLAETTRYITEALICLGIASVYIGLRELWKRVKRRKK